MNVSCYRWLALSMGVACMLACFGAGRAEAQIKLDLPQGKERDQIISGGKAAIENAVKLKEAYSDLTKIGKSAVQLEQMAKAGESLAKLGSGFGMAGAGIGMAVGVLEMFGVVESDQAKTERLLKEVSGKIDNLEQKMNSRFDALDVKLQQLDKKIQAGFAKAQIFPYSNKLDTIQGTVEEYYQGLAARQPNYDELDLLELRLTQIKPNSILEAMNAVHSCVLGDKFAANLLETEYSSTFGDMGRLGETCYLIARLTNQAEHNYVLVQTLQLLRGNETALKEAVPLAKDRVLRNPKHPYFQKTWDYPQIGAIVSLASKEFGPKIQRISAVLKEYTTRAVRERDANVIAYMEDRFGGKATIGTVANAATSFKPTLKAPQNKSNYEAKWGSLADELQRKYLCDWLVVVYHPIQRVSQNAFTGDANSKTFAWGCSENCIWFMGNDPDFAAGSQLVIVGLHRLDSPALKNAAPLYRYTLAQLKFPPQPTLTPGLKVLDERDLDNQADYGNNWGAHALHAHLGVERLNRAGVRLEQTGLVLMFRVAAEGTGGHNAEKANGGSVWFDSYASPKFTQPSPGEIVVPDSQHGSVDPHTVGLYGALYLKTTSPKRLGVVSGKGVLLIVHSSVDEARQ